MTEKRVLLYIITSPFLVFFVLYDIIKFPIIVFMIMPLMVISHVIDYLKDNASNLDEFNDLTDILTMGYQTWRGMVENK